MNIIKSLFYSLLFLFLFTGCSNQYDRALRSTNPKFIFETASSEFQQEKWNKALTLYEHSVPYFVNSDSASIITYNTAYANYKIKNYEAAANQFKSYYERYEDRKEESYYFSGYCYFLASPPYSLDQETTYKGIETLQGFINEYPNSDKISNINGYLDELRRKLEKKAYEIAFTYYQTYNYNSAIVSFSNMLENFPDTVLKEDAYYYIMISRYHLAISSVLKSKKTRLKEAILSTEQFQIKFPDSDKNTEASKLNKKLKLELKNFDDNNIT